MALRREYRLKQTAKDLIRAGYTTLEALEERMAYVLGEELTDEDKVIVAACLNNADNNEYYNSSIAVAVDRAKLEAAIKAITGVELTENQIRILDEFVAKCGNVAPSANIPVIDSFGAQVKLEDNSTPSYALDEDYKITDYTDNSGRIVLVTYAKGNEKVHFVLNYNTYAVKVRLEGVNNGEAFEVPSYGFRRINGTTLVK